MQIYVNGLLDMPIICKWTN